MDNQNHINNSIHYLTATWQLKNIRLLEKSKFTDNYVALTYSEKYKTDLVLKIYPYGDITYEQKTLEYFNGNGSVRLLDYDLVNRGLLLEYISPGISLKTLFPKDDNRAVLVASEVIKKLHLSQISQAKLYEFPTINSWLDLLTDFKSEKIPNYLVLKAKKLSDKLLDTQGKLYLLHGDLHHENILQSKTSWVAIDPKGVVGELEYEIGAFMRNPVPELLDQNNAKEIVLNRINQFSENFGFERKRLLDWTFVQAVLAACWSEWDYYIKYAEIIEHIDE